MIPHPVTAIPDEMIDEIRFEIDLAPHDSVVHFLQRSVVRFCEKSLYWQVDCEPVTVEPDVVSYPVVLNSDNLEIVSLIHLIDTDGIEIQKSLSECISPRYWQSSPATIDIYPTEKYIDKDLHLIAAVRPLLHDGEFLVSTSLLRDYRDGLIAGAKAMLYQVPNKPWTNSDQLRINFSIFDAMLTDAKRYVVNGYTKEQVRAPQKNRTFY